LITTERWSWYAARALAMSPREVAWRAGAKAAAITSPLLRRGSRPGPLVEDDDWSAAYARFRAAEGGPVLLDAARAPELATAHPGDAATVLAAADAVLERRFGYFGQDAVAFPGDVVDWNLDPRAGHRWPLVPSVGIDHRTCPGDPKWIWELNRLQHLTWLAQAWLFTGERRYADGALEQLDSWIAQNPVGRGIAWRGGFEAGVRASSVAVALQGLRDAPGLTVDRYRRAVTLLAACRERAWRDRSRFSSANNHLIGEMAGVAVVAILFPELAGAAEAELRAMAVLSAEADRQILPDGVGAEQSSGYQAFTGDMLLLPVALLRLRGDRPPAAIVGALRRSARFLDALCADGEPPVSYGDDDGGFALRLHADQIPTVGRHLAAVAGTVAGAPAHAPDLAAAWLAGPGASVPTERSATPGDLYAPDGGLVVLRRADRRITMDVGPLGYLSIAAHGHADALSMTLTAGGRELVVDPGTGSYYAEPAWRAAFRGTRMHATASVDDLDQSVAGGPFLWNRHAVTTVRAVDTVRGLVEAEHDGYRRLPDPVTHRRYLLVPPDLVSPEGDTVLVVDLFTGSGEHRVRTAWPLHPELEVSTGGDGHRVDRAGVPELRVTTAATAAPALYAVRGDEERRIGWWSRRFESRTSAWLVGVVLERRPLPLVVATLLTMSEAAAPSGLTVELRDGRIEARWTAGGRRAVIGIDTTTAGAVSISATDMTNRGD
jgi:hypothetical protein